MYRTLVFTIVIHVVVIIVVVVVVINYSDFSIYSTRIIRHRSILFYLIFYPFFSERNFQKVFYLLFLGQLGNEQTGILVTIYYLRRFYFLRSILLKRSEQIVNFK